MNPYCCNRYDCLIRDDKVHTPEKKLSIKYLDLTSEFLATTFPSRELIR